MEKVIALVVAAGSGERAGGGLPKQYRPIAGKPIVRRACEALLAHPRIDDVRVVIGQGQERQAALAMDGLKVGAPILGGRRRQDSVRSGLGAVEGSHVLIHDAARPFCPPGVVDRLLDALAHSPGVVPVLPVADTLMRNGEVVPREGLLRVQTPQAFHLDAIRRAHEAFAGEATDDAGVLRAHGLEVATVAGDMRLEKITTADDLARAEERLVARMLSRTGMGFDVHAFGGPGPLVIGGLSIPHERGLAGHSDADVVLHAITDALLGAAGEGDIGLHFPPSDERWRGAASDRFLVHAAELIRARGGVIDHVDATVICEAPRIGPHRDAMRARIADILQLPVTCVSVKATTTERLGFAGRGEGMAAQAVATIRMEYA